MRIDTITQGQAVKAVAFRADNKADETLLSYLLTWFGETGEAIEMEEGPDGVFRVREESGSVGGLDESTGVVVSELPMEQA